MHFIAHGEGRPLLLIHGLGAASFVWEPIIEPLGTRRSVVAPDLPGHGRSPAAETPCATAFADALLTLMHDQGHRSFDVVGNSMGAWIALWMALRAPETVRRVVAVAPAFVFGPPAGISAEELARRAAPATRQDATAYLERLSGREPAPKDIETLLAGKDRVPNPSALLPLAESIVRGEDSLREKDLRAIDAPCLVVHGADDGVVSAAASQRVAECLPCARLLVLDQSGHWPQADQPEAFHTALEGFLG